MRVDGQPLSGTSREGKLSRSHTNKITPLTQDARRPSPEENSASGKPGSGETFSVSHRQNYPADGPHRACRPAREAKCPPVDSVIAPDAHMSLTGVLPRANPGEGKHSRSETDEITPLTQVNAPQADRPREAKRPPVDLIVSTTAPDTTREDRPEGLLRDGDGAGFDGQCDGLQL